MECRSLLSILTDTSASAKWPQNRKSSRRRTVSCTACMPVTTWRRGDYAAALQTTCKRRARHTSPVCRTTHQARSCQQCPTSKNRRNFLLGNISHLALALIIEALPLAVHLPLRFAILPGNTKGLSMIRTTLLAGAVLLLAVSSSPAAKHRAEVLAEAAPADAVSKEIAPLLQPTGIRVMCAKICYSNS